MLTLPDRVNDLVISSYCSLQTVCSSWLRWLNHCQSLHLPLETLCSASSPPNMYKWQSYKALKLIFI